MRSRTFLALGLATATILSASPSMTAYAETSSTPAYDSSEDSQKASPRYLYIQRANISVHPATDETVYLLYIKGTSDVTSISGTATLYKKNASGNYVKIDSEKLSFKGSTVDYKGYLASNGSGDYMIEFVATIYTNSGNESVTFQNSASLK